MNFAPDFGLRLIDDGATPEMDIHLVPFELDHFSVVNEDLFTTMANNVYEGVEHAISLDFGVEILKSIHALCPDDVAEHISHELATNFDFGHTIELPQPVSLAVTARLGELQSAEFEEYVPLVVQKVDAI